MIFFYHIRQWLLPALAAACLISCNDQWEEVYCGAEKVTTKNDRQYFKNEGILFEQGQNQSDKFSRTGNFSCELSKESPFGMTFKTEAVKAGDCFEVSVWRKSSDGKGFLVLSDQKHNVFYYPEDSVVQKEENGWELLQIIFTIPPFYENEGLKVYAWNPSETPCYFDDLRIRRIEGDRKPPETPMALHLKLSDDDLRFFKNARNEAEKDRLIRAELKDWRKADLKDGEREVEIEMRLKGDWLDHLSREKWSMRIKIEEDTSWNRLMEFSIQNPATRHFLSEWVYHKLLEQEDVLTTTYEFVPVTINGVYLGIFAMEEHFEKQLFESRNRREGMVLKYDEEGLFENTLQSKQTGSDLDVSIYRAAVIEPYGKKSAKDEEEPLHRQFRRAQNLMYQLQHGWKKSNELFNTDQLARFSALVDLCRAHHSMRWHNQRHYYNPVLSLLAPIGYDGYAKAGEMYPDYRPITGYIPDSAAFLQSKNEDELLFSSLFNDPQLAEKYVDYLEKYTNPDFLDQFFKKQQAMIDSLETILQKDYPFYRFDRNFLYRNAQEIRKVLPEYKAMLAEKAIENNKNLLKQYPRIIEECPGKAGLKSVSLKAYKEKESGDIISVKAYNYHCAGLKIIGAGDEEGKIEQVFTPSVSLSPYSTFGELQFKMLQLKDNYDYLLFEVNGLDSVFSSEIIPWPFPDTSYGNFQAPDFRKFSWITLKGKEVWLKAGKHDVTKSIFIPEGYTVHIPKGTTLNLMKKATFLSYSPVYIEGTEANPVYLLSEDRTAAGFNVMKTGKRSSVKNCIMKNFSTWNDEARQLTGGMTFYEADVDLENVAFINNNCEDALNIVRSDFKMEGCYFEGTFSDAFDGDFCTGVVYKTTLKNIGNDGLDFSGSKVEVNEVDIQKCGDKGISIGEASSAMITKSTISNAAIAVSSKDLSQVDFTQSMVKDCEYVVAVYCKKPEYGPASMKTAAIDFEDVKNEYILDLNSTLVWDEVDFTGQERLDVDKLFY